MVIFVVVSLSVDGDRAVTYGAYKSKDAALIKRQFVMREFGKEAWVEKSFLNGMTMSKGGLHRD